MLAFWKMSLVFSTSRSFYNNYVNLKLITFFTDHIYFVNIYHIWYFWNVLATDLEWDCTSDYNHLTGPEFHLDQRDYTTANSISEAISQCREYCENLQNCRLFWVQEHETMFVCSFFSAYNEMEFANGYASGAVCQLTEGKYFKICTYRIFQPN